MIVKKTSDAIRISKKTAVLFLRKILKVDPNMSSLNNRFFLQLDRNGQR